MRTALIYILICCEFFSIQAQKLSGSESPYIWAGDSTITLTANSINSGKTFDVFIISETGDKMKVSFDFISKIVKVSDYSERVIYADTIASGVSAFLTIDSKAEENRNISPYVYCNDNPIYLVDFDGMRPTAYESICNIFHKIINNHKTLIFSVFFILQISENCLTLHQFSFQKVT